MTENSIKGALSTFLIITMFFLAPIFYHVPFVSANLPSSLQEGDYAQYKQEFSIGETHQLYWKITQLNSSFAVIRIISHSVRFNYSTLSFSINPGGGIMTIRVSNWEIQRLTFLNGTEMPDQPIGEKVPFWIPTSVTEDTPIDTLYDLNVTPALVGPLAFECLPTPRMCWMTDNQYSPQNWMQRYYDTATGIVLKIVSFLQVFESSISITETLNDTNIATLQQLPATLPPFFLIGLGAIALTLTAIIVLLIRYRRRHR